MLASVHFTTVPSNLNSFDTIQPELELIEQLRGSISRQIDFSVGTPFPDGTMISRLAWCYVPSEQNNKVFGRSQSFVAGPAPEWYLQVMVKDSGKYATTGGWGFAQFDNDGKAAEVATIQTCFPCHAQVKGSDLVFTHYAP